MTRVLATPFLLFFAAILTSSNRYIAASLQAYGVVAITTLIAGVGALAFAAAFLTAADFPDVLIPQQVIDRNAFLWVAVMHSFSYLGGVAGIVSGICYLILRRDRSEKRSSPLAPRLGA